MIIAAPQLSDWGNSSAEQTIALTEYLLDAYSIDRGKVYINGYSGGGETLSLVLTKRPELFHRGASCRVGLGRRACAACAGENSGLFRHRGIR
ncbi:MAG: S9 family peptidase [Oscillospiraceae bacterium]|nr:MAG: S9 family peptidase [Oscillospiraceae bacterium]